MSQVPATARVAEAAALQALCERLELPVTQGQIGQLQAFLDLLERWNQAYNLTAVRQRSAMLSHHVADCLAALPALNRQLPVATPNTMHTQRPRILDVGSGGGLPGVVWAIFRPDCDIVCADAVAKKTAFVQQAAGQLSLAPKLSSKHGRIEQAKPSSNWPAFSLITSRAFASLADFTQLTAHLLAPGGVWLAMKGRQDETEGEMQALLAARQQIGQPTRQKTEQGSGPGAEASSGAVPVVDVFHVEHLTVPGLDAQRCLVWMRPG